MGYNRSTKSVARRLTSSKRLKLSVRSLQGVLQNSQEIAIKKLSLGSQQGICEFLNEVLLLLKVQQRNLVSLLGCCASFGHKMLVYPYFPNGSLDHILFGICTLRSLVATTVDFTMRQQWPIRGSAEHLLSLATSDLFLSSSHQVDDVLSKFKAVAIPSMQLCSNGFSRQTYWSYGMEAFRIFVWDESYLVLTNILFTCQLIANPSLYFHISFCFIGNLVEPALSTDEACVYVGAVGNV